MSLGFARWIVPALFAASALAATTRPTAAGAAAGSAAAGSAAAGSAEAGSAAAGSAEAPTSVVTKTSRAGRWHVAETKNFFVCSDQSLEQARRLAEGAEEQRAALQKLWLGSISDQAWTPQCHLVLHATREGYVAAVGRGGQWTIGSSLVHSDEGKVTGRRIDLVCSTASPGGQNDYLTAALPHELTHVVLRDRFPAEALPHWADEGTAVLADGSEKQYRHARDLQQALSARTTFQAVELLNAGDYPDVARLGTFYGQSASLVKYLVDRAGHARFIAFLAQAKADGYDKALAEHYAIRDVRELDRNWRTAVDSEQFVLVGPSTAFVGAE
jgi:hypothetical protein